ncbi:MAG TPA: branched-chain amino acid ABC transporter permease, partial [bacterium]|nr:branched-chain amino acid ABC transporter permease [bacterium]
MKRVLLFVLLLGALLALGAVLPRVMNPYFFRIFMLCGINIILAVSLNLINGFTGQFSIGHAGFMAVGAYTAAMISLHGGQSWSQGIMAAGVPPFFAHGAALVLALVAGGAAAAIAGYMVGLPSLR